MFEKRLMAAALRKQSYFLDEFLEGIESKSSLDFRDYLYCHEQLQQSINNMKQVRKIGHSYQRHLFGNVERS